MDADALPPLDSDAGGSEEDCAEDDSPGVALVEMDVVGVEGKLISSSPQAAKITASESKIMQRNRKVDRFILFALLCGCWYNYISKGKKCQQKVRKRI